MRRVLILGATSPIARAMAGQLAAEGALLFLAGRDLVELERLASDLQIRHQTRVEIGRVDGEDFPSHPAFLEKAVGVLEGIDGVIFAIGHLGEQPRDSIDSQRALKLVQVNLGAAVSLLAPLATLLEEQGHGFIIGLSSVAGDRGRRSNYAYGAAKAGLSLYLDGLRHRLNGKGVKVLTLKLGFVDTGMTYGVTHSLLTVSPEKVGRLAIGSLDRPSGVYYLPAFWRVIMLIVRWIPESVFRRLDI